MSAKKSTAATKASKVAKAKPEANAPAGDLNPIDTVLNLAERLVDESVTEQSPATLLTVALGEIDVSTATLAESAVPTMLPFEEIPAPEIPTDTVNWTEGTAMPAKPKSKKANATKPAQEPKPKSLSAIEAAEKVLAESAEPMNTRTMIEAMAKQQLWTSPGGQTPAATLYSAILCEISMKGNGSRFVKTERGKFAYNRTV